MRERIGVGVYVEDEHRNFLIDVSEQQSCSSTFTYDAGESTETDLSHTESSDFATCRELR